MTIPSLSQWLQETSLNVFRPRSTQLKMVDSAIEQYGKVSTENNKGKIKLAFDAWKRSKGNWQQNDRNRNGALTRLDKELQTVKVVRFTPEELRALAFIAEQRKAVLKNLFQGKKVTFKGPKSAKEAVKQAATELKIAAQTGTSFLKSAGKPSMPGAPNILKEKLETMAKSLFEVESLGVLGDLNAFILGIIAECSVSAAPVIGHIKDGYDLVSAWGKAGKSYYKEHDIAGRSYSIDTGAPAAAFGALKVCLAQETRTQICEASIATTSFALKTGLTFVDGGAVSGPAVGVAKALAQVSLQIFNLAGEWRATRDVNKVLTSGPLDINLFKTYPLMGCYLLTSATLSDIIPIDCFGQPGWVDYIEDVKKRGFDGIYESASGLLESSPWEIQGLPKRPVKGGMSLLSTAMKVPGGANDLLGDVFA